MTSRPPPEAGRSDDDSIVVPMLDRTKPIWRVRGTLPAPDLRRMTCFVNAASKSDAIAAAKDQGLGSVESVYHVTKDDIRRWEALVPSAKPKVAT